MRLLLLFWLLFLFPASGFRNAVSDPETSQNTRNLLHQLYDRTGGQHWNYTMLRNCMQQYNITLGGKGKWDFTKNGEGEYLVDPCSKNNTIHFIGIGCSTGLTANVTAIVLPCGNLTGKIPDLSAFTEIETINFSKNNLTGTIPELKNLTQLQRLYLYENKLTGTIPDYSNLTKLLYLYLYENKLTGTIPDWSNLINLQYIGLSRNYLTGTIPEVKMLTELEYLYIYENQMTGTIPEMSALTKLVVLHLANN